MDLEVSERIHPVIDKIVANSCPESAFVGLSAGREVSKYRFAGPDHCGFRRKRRQIDGYRFVRYLRPIALTKGISPRNSEDTSRTAPMTHFPKSR
jgi:hypothetical protein